MPPSSSAAVPPSPRARHIPFTLIIAVIFGVGVVLFGFLAATAWTAKNQAQSTLKAAQAKAFSDGQLDQKTKDDAKAHELAAAPYKKYEAPAAFGSFSLKYPKDWNLYAVETPTGTTQLNLTFNPDLIRQLSSADNAYALRVLLLRTSYADLTKSQQDKIKNKKLTATPATVSGIAGTRYEGSIDEKHVGVMVLVPVRDKTIQFTTDSRTYLAEFNTVLAQAVINP